MASIKIERINAAFQLEIANIIKNKLDDPRLNNTLISVVRVETSADLSYSKIYLSIYTKKSTEDAFNAILNSIPFIRRQVAASVKIRNMPILQFKIDDSMQYAENIDNIIKKIKK